jgi:hypothetical protein
MLTFYNILAEMPGVARVDHRTKCVSLVAISLSQNFESSNPRSKREADHSSRSSTEVKNDGAIPPLPHKSSRRGAQLFKHRENFNLLTFNKQQGSPLIVLGTAL